MIILYPITCNGQPSSPSISRAKTQILNFSLNNRQPHETKISHQQNEIGRIYLGRQIMHLTLKKAVVKETV